MRSTSPRHDGEPLGGWRSLGTITAAAFAMQPSSLKSTIDPTARRSDRRPLPISRPSAPNVMLLPPPSSGGGATAAAPSRPSTSPGGRSPGPGEQTGYRSLSVRIAGVAPLVMHSGVLADPLSPASKELKRIAKKRPKTDADIEYMQRVEWTGGLWLSGGLPCIPGEAIESAFVQAARKTKRGQIAKAGMISPGDWPILYDGPRDMAELWENDEFRLVSGVRVGNARVMRTRPIFQRWAATVMFEYLDDQLSESDLIDILRVAGRIVGIGDWRPRYGRFEIVS